MKVLRTRLIENPKVRLICHMARDGGDPKVAYCGARPKHGIWGGLLTCNCLRCLTTVQAEHEARQLIPQVRTLAMRRVRQALLMKEGLWHGRTPSWFRSQDLRSWL